MRSKFLPLAAALAAFLPLRVDAQVQLTLTDVQTILSQSVSRALEVSPNALIAIVDNNGIVLAVWSVNGAIRGFDARTGALRWTWDPLVREAKDGIEPTPANVGGGNNWTPMSVDNERDLVFIPTASPAPIAWGTAVDPGSAPPRPALRAASTPRPSAPGRKVAAKACVGRPSATSRKRAPPTS